MSTITSKQSKASALVHVQALMAGREKHFPNGSFTLGNAAYTTASLVQAFQALADALTVVTAAQGAARSRNDGDPASAGLPELPSRDVQHRERAAR